MYKRIVIVGNGTLSKKILAVIQPGDYVIGVDRAAYWLIREGRLPDVAIGDFDSVTEEELSQIKKSVPSIRQFSKDKDQTDMELAIQHAIRKRPMEVVVLGGTGSRLDHTIATLQLLDLLLTAKIPHVLMNETNKIRLIGRGKTVIEKASYRYLSILPYTKNIIFSLNGFRYDLVRKTLQQGITRGVSNEIQKAQGVIRIFSGKAWVVESND